MKRLTLLMLAACATGCTRVHPATGPTAASQDPAYVLARQIAERPEDPALWERLAWQRLIEASDVGAAAAAFARALELEPGRPMSHWGLFLLAEDHGDLASAVAHARALLSESPGFPLAPAVRIRLEGLRHLGPSLTIAAEIRDVLALSKVSTSEVGIAPLDDLWRRYQAALLDRAAGATEARPAWIEELRACQKLAPRFAHVAAELGDSETTLNRRWQAYQTALALDPEHLRAQAGIAGLLLDRGLAEEAAKTLARAASRYPRSPLILVAQARTELARGHTAAALRLAQDALFTAPDYLPALRLALEHGRGHRPAESQEALARRALGLAPADPVLRQRLDEALLEQGKATDPQVDPNVAEGMPPREVRDAPDPRSDARRWIPEIPDVTPEAPLPLAEWLSQARDLDAEPFSSITLYHFKQVVVAAGGTVLTRRRIVASVRHSRPEGERCTVDYTPAEQELHLLRAERRSVSGELLGLARQLDEPSPLLQAADARLYNDQRQRTLVFDGLQPGDVLDIEYTLEGRGQSAGQWLGDLVPLSTDSPTVLGVFELDIPKSMPIRIEAFGPHEVLHTRRETEARVQHRFEAHSIRGIRVEPRMPGVIEKLPYVVVAATQGYAEIARWYIELAGLGAPPRPESSIQELARSLCGPQPDQAAERVYDYVRSNIRYVGFEFGQYDFKPREPAEVSEARYGDCKDQARLAVELLAHCGIPAEIVMLRTRSAGRVRMDVPYVGLFNHAIVFLPTLGLYADPTAPGHRLGELPADDLAAPSLRVRPDAELETTPRPAAADHRQEVRMRLRMTGGPDTPILAQGRREVLYTGLFCPPVREALGARFDGIEQLAVHGARIEAGDLRREDLPNRLRLSYRLRFPLVGSQLAVNLAPLQLVERLGLAPGRTQPLRLAHPLSFASTIELDVAALDQEPDLPEAVELSAPGATYRFEARRGRDGLIVLIEELAIDRLEVPTSELADLYELCAEVDRVQTWRLGFRARRASR